MLPKPNLIMYIAPLTAGSGGNQLPAWALKSENWLGCEIPGPFFASARGLR